MIRTAYLHGFASSSKARKGTALAEAFRERGHTLLVPDLNVPSFAEMTYTRMLGAIDALVAEHGPDDTWRFIGSSQGGYLAARWAQLNPERVDRLLLLCPGFDMMSRWVDLMGEEAFALWEKNGAFFFPDATGEPTPVKWAFVEDARHSHPPLPDVPCDTRIIHGTQDETVPIDLSRAYAAARPHVSLIEVDDGHDLVASLPRITTEALGFIAPR